LRSVARKIGIVRAVDARPARRVRRWLFGVACTGIVATVAEPGVTRDLELQGAGYTGTSTGAWTCGPSARVHYGGVGAQVRWSEQHETERHGRGGTVVAGAALEYEHSKIIDSDSSDECTAPPCASPRPPNAILPGFGGRVGYDWRLFGFQLGAQVWSAWSDPTDRHATLYALPELELRGGPQDIAWAIVGFGSPLVTTYRRWGLYGGVGVRTGEGQASLTLGDYRSGPAGLDTMAPRADFAWWMPFVPPGIGPRLGVGLSRPSPLIPQLDWEVSLGVVGLL
jgi:hypothetical protein